MPATPASLISFGTAGVAWLSAGGGGACSSNRQTRVACEEMRTDPIMPPILFDGQEVRMVTVDGDARLVGNDVARRWAT
jgi:hypothetical protein